MNVSNSAVIPLKKFRAKPIADFDWVTYKTVRIEISVGRNYHEGARLKATLDWARASFDNVVLLIGDTLQRYNLMMDGISAEDAYTQSQKDGCDWIERNKLLLEGVAILRWDEIVQHPDFVDARTKINALYQTNVLVYQEVKKAMDEVAMRRDVELTKLAIFKRLSENYLLEEIAGAAIANKLYPGVSAYPGQLPGLWNIMHQLPLNEVPNGLSDARSIELKIYKK